MNKRIVFITQKISGGGAERVVSVLSNSLCKLNYDVQIIAYFPTNGEYQTGECVNKKYLTNSENEYKNLHFLKKIRLLRKLIKGCDAEYLIPFLWFVGLHTFLANIGLHCKVIQTVRNNPKEVPREALLRFIRNITFCFANKGFVQNKLQMEYFPEFIKHKLVIVPNPVSNAFFDNSHDYVGKATKIVAAGRLNKQKNFSMLIEAAAILSKESNLPFLIDIYGEGEELNNLQNLIDGFNLSKVCTLKGKSENMAKTLCEYNVFVMTSNYEGMPNALMESMASGLACISTNCETGPSDLIKDGENGILIDVNDTRQLANALESLIGEIDLQVEMGSRGKETVQELFAAENIAKLFADNLLENQ